MDRNSCCGNYSCYRLFLIVAMFVNLGFVVAGYNAFYVAHTAVSQLYSVSVKDFVQQVGFREMLSN